MYSRDIYVGWGDLDANGHMRNTSYLDRGADVRMMFFADRGFPISELARLGVGPVVRRDEIEYFRECRLLDVLRVTVAFSAMSADAARFTVVNEFFRGDALVARVVSSGGWLDHRARTLVAPPPVLGDVLRNAPRTESFVELPPLAAS